MIILEFVSISHFYKETGITIFNQKIASKQRTLFTKSRESFYKLLSKQPGLTNYPNIIGEFLCPIIQKRIGIQSLTVKSVFFIQPDLWILEFPCIGSQYSFTGFQVASSFTLKELSKLKYSDFWKLFVFDVITGNGDRNLNNFFLRKNEHTFDYIPIDHGLSLLVPLISSQENEYFHFVSGYNGMAEEGVSSYVNLKKANLGTLISIASANPIYQKYYEAIQEKSDIYFKILHFLQSVEILLNNNYLNKLIHRIPKKIFIKEPDAYRAYLLETLLARIRLIQSSISAIATLA